MSSIVGATAIGGGADDAGALNSIKVGCARTVAVSVFHDENGNGKLDRNFIGMPKEGVGASNDAVGTLGPPKFDDARFSYKGGAQSLTIHLRYLL